MKIIKHAGLLIFFLVLAFALIASVRAEDNISKQDVSNQTQIVSSEIQLTNDGVINYNPVLQLYPEVNAISRGQTVEYTLVIQDSHRDKPSCMYPMTCLSGSEQSYAYNLDFVSKNSNIVGKFSQNEVTIEAGKTAKITVYVTGKEAGKYSFSLSVMAKDSNTEIKGELVVTDKNVIPSSETVIVSNGTITDNAYFAGNGFIISSDETLGQVIDLKMVKDGSNILGKMVLNHAGYALKGSAEGQDLSFKVYDPSSNQDIAVFNGSIKQYNDFTLVKGTLKMNKNGEIFVLTATSIKANTIRDVKIVDSKTEIDNAKLKEVIALQSNSSDQNTELKSSGEFIEPMQISKEKFLSIIPNPWGKNVLEVQVIGDNGTITKKIKENDKAQVGKYVISVGSLADKENIDLKVE